MLCRVILCADELVYLLIEALLGGGCIGSGATTSPHMQRLIVLRELAGWIAVAEAAVVLYIVCLHRRLGWGSPFTGLNSHDLQAQLLPYAVSPVPML